MLANIEKINCHIDFCPRQQAMVQRCGDKIMIQVELTTIKIKIKIIDKKNTFDMNARQVE